MTASTFKINLRKTGQLRGNAFFESLIFKTVNNLGLFISLIVSGWYPEDPEI